jgi:hypothetical protein
MLDRWKITSRRYPSTDLAPVLRESLSLLFLNASRSQERTTRMYKTPVFGSFLRDYKLESKQPTIGNSNFYHPEYMPYLSMTRLKLRSPRYLPSFLIYNSQIVEEIRVSHGFLKGKQSATLNLSMWTATLWNSYVDLQRFYRTGSHAKVMSQIDMWSSEAASGNREVYSLDIPSWQSIGLFLTESGHFLNLKNPSHKHQERTIQAPRFLVTVPITPL